MADRYDTSGNIEAQFEPGSDGRVLRNLRGICDPAEMDDVELDLLDQPPTFGQFTQGWTSTRR